jgi:hypothetical protein
MSRPFPKAQLCFSLKQALEKNNGLAYGAPPKLKAFKITFQLKPDKKNDPVQRMEI